MCKWNRHTDGKQRLSLKSVLQPLPPWPAVAMCPRQAICCVSQHSVKRMDEISADRQVQKEEVEGSWECNSPASGPLSTPWCPCFCPNCQNQTQWGWHEGLTCRSKACARSLATAHWRLLMLWALRGLLSVHGNVCQQLLVDEGTDAINRPPHWPATSRAHQSTQNCPGVYWCPN